MMKITGLSHLFKWENLHNWWLTKYFFAPLYQFAYEILYIIMKIWPWITPIMKIIFQHSVPTATH